MTEEKTLGMSPEARRDLEKWIIELLQKHIYDKDIVLTRATRRDEVSTDSIDIVNVIFAIEVKFGVVIDLSAKVAFATVGDLLDALISFIPDHSDTHV